MFLISEKDGLGIRKWGARYFVPIKLVADTQVLCDSYDVDMNKITGVSEYYRTIHIAHFFVGTDLTFTGKDIKPKITAKLSPRYTL